MQKKSAAALACLEDYGRPEKFLVTFNPSMQARYCRDLQRVYTGRAPSLATLADAYGSNIPEAWLMAQLRDLSEFSGARDKLGPEQCENIAGVIMFRYPHVKVTELMLFFMLFKSGEFGKFYGSVDGLAITEALKTFMSDRLAQISKYERIEEEEKERARVMSERQAAEKFRIWRLENRISLDDFLWFSSNGISDLDEIRELHWLINLGYEPQHLNLPSQNISVSSPKWYKKIFPKTRL